MKKKDLVEFLRSTVESDAVVSRLFNLFHVTYGYSIEELNSIVEYGIQRGDFVIEDVRDSKKKYSKIEWRGDNVSQEVLMVDESEYVGPLFSGNGVVPNNFKQFLG